MPAPTFQPKGSPIGRHLPWQPLLVLLVTLLGASPLACHTSPAPEFKSATPTSSVVVRNARLPGGAPIEILIVGGLVAEVGPSIPTNNSDSIDANGRYLVPGIIDSHVHLAYLPVGEAMVKAGIAGAVDLAAPLPLRAPAKGLDLLSAGPMLTAIGGYPTRSWGQDGYGLEVDSKPGIDEALARLQDAGARLVKFSLGAGPDLDEELLQYLVTEARRRSLLVGVHALGCSDLETLRVSCAQGPARVWSGTEEPERTFAVLRSAAASALGLRSFKNSLRTWRRSLPRKAVTLRLPPFRAIRGRADKRYLPALRSVTKAPTQTPSTARHRATTKTIVASVGARRWLR